MLADRDIHEARLMSEIGIKPFRASQVNPASYDLTLDREYKRPGGHVSVQDCREIEAGHMTSYLPQEDEHGEYIAVQPGGFILASSVEKIDLGPYHAARVEGKSSLGRLGLVVHVTAGFIDPGFSGTVTLEIANLAPWYIYLRPGQRICQIAFERMSSPVMRLYGAKGHYQNQSGPTESRFRMTQA